MLKKLSFFVFFKYVNFAVKGVKGLLIAKILGPYTFGIWAFLLMIEQYVSYKNLGIHFALNIELSNNFERKKYIEEYVSRSFTTYIIVSLIAFSIASVYYLLDLDFFLEYGLNDFVFIIVIHATLRNFQAIFANIYRVYNKFNLIIISEFLFHAFPLVTIFFFEGTELIYALLISAIFSLSISLVFYSYNSPIPIAYFRLVKNTVSTSSLLKDSLLLLMINISVYLFNLASKTFVSVYYSVEELGQFSFAISITMASLLGIKAALWAIYPNIIKKLNTIKDNDELSNFVNKVERMNSFLFINLIHVVMLCTPVLFFFFPEYDSSKDVLIILLVAQGIVSMGLGYNTFIMNRKKFLDLVRLNLLALLFALLGNFIIASIGMKLVHIGQVILMSYLIVLIGMNSIYRKNVFRDSFFASIKGLEFKKLFQMLFLAILVSIQSSSVMYIIAISFFIFNFINFKDFHLIKNFVKKGNI